MKIRATVTIQVLDQNLCNNACPFCYNDHGEYFCTLFRTELDHKSSSFDMVSRCQECRKSEEAKS